MDVKRLSKFRKAQMPISPLKDSLYRSRTIRWATQAMLLRGTPDCVFIWIPKTAGTSLYHWLHDNIGMRKMNVPRDYSTFPGHGAATFGHVHYLSLLYQGFVPQSFHDRAYRFAMVRNPYSRIASLYNYLRIDQGYAGEFPAFVEDVRLNRPPVGLYNHRGLSQTNPQVDWLMGWNGAFLADNIFKVEEMDTAIACLAQQFHIATPPPVESRNVSKKFVSVEDFDHETIEKVNEIYARDFALLEYDRITDT